jgi:hypothetical protein
VNIVEKIRSDRSGKSGMLSKGCDENIHVINYTVVVVR